MILAPSFMFANRIFSCTYKETYKFTNNTSAYNKALDNINYIYI